MSGRRRLFGNMMILVGVIVILFAGFLLIRDQLRRQQMLARLEEKPFPATATATWTSSPPATATATATIAFTHTPVPPTHTLAPTATPAAAAALPATEPPAMTATVVPAATFTALPPTDTPVPPTATWTPTMAPTPTLAPAKLVRMRAPAIDLDTKVVEVGWTLVEQNGTMTSVWETASYAAGHHINSVLPGQGGNIVLSGHHNIEGEVFRYIVDLEAGDEIVLENERGESFVYRVMETMILPEAGVSEEQRRANAAYISATDEERLTLVTCWPYWTNTHRVIVIARPAP